MLARMGVQPNWVDIDQDPQLRQQFNDSVPVVEILGRIRFQGRVSEALLRRTIKAEMRGRDRSDRSDRSD
jgi:hypothetical protein